MSIEAIKKKYGCTYKQAINIFCGLNTPAQLGLKELKVEKKTKEFKVKSKKTK